MCQNGTTKTLCQWFRRFGKVKHYEFWCLNFDPNSQTDKTASSSLTNYDNSRCRLWMGSCLLLLLLGAGWYKKLGVTSCKSGTFGCTEKFDQRYMGMGQYLLLPYLGGWTSIYQLFLCSPGVQGFDPLPYTDSQSRSGFNVQSFPTKKFADHDSCGWGSMVIRNSKISRGYGRPLKLSTYRNLQHVNWWNKHE